MKRVVLSVLLSASAAALASAPDRTGEERSPLYFRDLVSSVTTYEQQLCGFERIDLKPGEQKTVRFTVQNEQLSLLNRANQRVVEPGEFKFMVGGGSADIRKDATIHVVAEAKQ